MTAVAMPPIAPQLHASQSERRDLVAELRAATLACRVHHQKLGIRKALTREQMKNVAERFDADARALAASKCLIDRRDPAYRKVVNVRTRAGEYWRSVTTPYPEPGIRLIRRATIDEFDQRMLAFRAELHEAAKALQAKYEELRDRARVQLGDLFIESDYPERIDEQFELSWDYPSIEPPAYLKDLHPHLYEQECERIKGRLEEAVRLTEQSFVTKFNELVSHLAEKLKGDVDGKPKKFQDSSLENLNAFFEQFRSLDFGSSEQLQQLVDNAQKAVSGIRADDLRSNEDQRNRVASSLGEIQAALDGLMVSKPKRAIDLEDEE
jgi:hypothetical protein